MTVSLDIEFPADTPLSFNKDEIELKVFFSLDYIGRTRMLDSAKSYLEQEVDKVSWCCLNLQTKEKLDTLKDKVQRLNNIFGTQIIRGEANRLVVKPDEKQVKADCSPNDICGIPNCKLF